MQIGVIAMMAFALVGPITNGNTPTAAATASDETAFLDALNDVRSDAGLPALALNPQLSDLARDHAEVMANADEIFHANPISAGYEGPWSKIGENVGVGANVSALVDAFAASPGHYANIVDPAFTEIGIGVAWRGNALYTVHRFLEVPGAPVTTAPPLPTVTVPVNPVPSLPSPASPPEPTTTATTTPLGAPSISADRVLALLELLDQVGT